MIGMEEDRGFHLGTTIVTVVVAAVLLNLAAVWPWAAGLLSAVLCLSGLGKVGQPGRLRPWPGVWGPMVGRIDGVVLFVAACLPLSLAAAVIWVGAFGS